MDSLPDRLARTLGAAVMGTLLATTLAVPAHAGPDTGYPDRFSLRGSGFFVTDMDTELRVDSTSGLGTTLNANRILGLPRDETVARVDGYLRFGTNHRIDFSWYQLELEGSRTLSTEVTIGDQTFPVNAGVSTLFRTDTYKLGYSYSFYRNAKVDLGLGLGAYVQDVKFRVTRTVGEQREDRALTAPLPVFIFRLDYAITRRLLARGQLQLFVIEYEEYEGRLSDFEVDLEYRILRNLAIGVGYNFVSLNLESEKERLRGSLDYGFNGALAYGTLYF